MVTYKEKPWLQHYDNDVPPSLAPYPNHPLHDLLIHAGAEHGDDPATIMSANLPVLGRVEHTLSYHDVNLQSDALAAGLVDLGIQKGDRVAIIMPNNPQFVITFFAILKAGATVVAINPTFPPHKLAEQLVDSGAKAAIVMTLFYDNLKQIQSRTSVEHVIVTNIKEYLPPVARVLFTLAREKKEGHRITKHTDDLWFQDVLARYKRAS